MSFLKKASLLTIPTAYKQGKLYSVKPDDGTGDFTFSRSTSATRVNSDGLIEKERKNLVLQSNTFDTTWTLSNGATVTNGQAGYDNSNDAWLLEASIDDAGVRVQQSIFQSGIITSSVYAKAGTTDWFRIEFGGAASLVYFDLTNGLVDGELNAIGKIESVGNGWYRCSAINTSGTTPSTIRFHLASAVGDINVIANDNIYIQDAQLEAGLVATDYIETTTSTVSTGIVENIPRIDYSSGVPALLLEPQRTNLVSNSEFLRGRDATIYFNDTVSPEGLLNAVRAVETTSLFQHGIFKTMLLPTDPNPITYTNSVFVKAKEREFLALNFYSDSTNYTSSAFDLVNGTYAGGSEGKIEDFGNGWYRCSYTVTVTQSTGDYNFASARMGISSSSFYYTGDGSSSMYFYGFQVEQGSYPTSYIPTYGTSVTRTAENNVSLSNFDFFTLGSTQSGTFFYEVKFTKGYFENRVNVFNQGGSGTNFWLVTNFYLRTTTGVNSFNTFDINSSIINDYIKILIRKDGNNFNLFINGTKSTTTLTIDTDVTPLHWVDYFSIYQNTQDIKLMIEFPTALSDADCEILTGEAYSSFEAMANSLNYTIYG